MSIENTENNVVELDITSAEDRQKFEEERLYPSLKRIYSGIMGSARTPIISGSVALYLQGIYLDKFPKDIDIIFDNYDSVIKYKIIYNKLCKRFNFYVDFLRGTLLGDNKNFVETECDDITIKMCDVDTTINNLQLAYNRYKDNKPNKAAKYLAQYNYLKEHYPQYFAENAEA